MSSCLLRPATPDDAAAVAAIWYEGWTDGHVGHVPAALLAYRQPEHFVPRTRERIDSMWIAERDGRPAGFVVVKENEIEQLFVDRAARGTGVAALLLRKGEEEIRRRGYDRAWLAVVAGNARARAFYARCGWRDTGPFTYMAETADGPFAVPSHRYEIDLGSGRVPPRLLLALVLILAFGFAAHARRAVTLSMAIVDAATGQPTPARVLLEDASGLRPRVSGALAVSETAIPIPRQAIAVMWGQQDRAQGYALQPDGSFYVDGAFDAAVQPGAYIVTISKGFEYVRQSLPLAVDAAVRHAVRLERWVDMPSRGWYSADDHIHLRRSPGDDAAILRWIAAEDIHVGNLLQMGDFWAVYFPQYAFGAAGRYHEGGRWLSPGQEDPRTPEVGHTISLGASQWVRFASDYYSYDRVFDRVRELGGVTGFAHQGVSFHGYRGMVLNTLRGKNDFLELAQFCVPEGPLALDYYYMFLDLGIRLTALAGSDYPWCGRGPAYGSPAPQIAQIGNARFYTRVGGPLSFDSWLAAVKAGRTFVTTGPMVFLTVNDAGPGDTVDVKSGARVRITAEALGHPAQVPLESLEIVGHGRVLARADGKAAARLAAAIELPVAHGMWIAARAKAGTAQVAHTTPVYVTVNGGGFANPATLGARLDAAEQYLRELEAELAAPGTNLDSQASRHRTALQRQIAEARAVIERLRRGGGR